MDTLAAGTLVAGRYRVVRQLGRGGMGVVYAAEDVGTGEPSALKVMHRRSHRRAEREARFRREARASARITSAHVVKITGTDVAPELDGAPFLVMELLEGEDVECMLARRGKLDARETVDLLAQVARGLDEAHAAGVIHRDLKPENVFVHRCRDGSAVVKLLDLGMSKVLGEDEEPSASSMNGAPSVMGTPLSMAPEQVSGREEHVGPATDVWAVGLMAARMLTGEIYWSGETVPEIFVQIMADRRAAPSARWPALTLAFDAWFAKSLALRPRDRFRSAGEQVSALSVVLLGRDVTLRPRRRPRVARVASVALRALALFADVARLGALPLFMQNKGRRR